MCRSWSSTSRTGWAVRTEIFQVAFWKYLLAYLIIITIRMTLLICEGEKCVGAGDEAPSLANGLYMTECTALSCFVYTPRTDAAILQWRFRLQVMLGSSNRVNDEALCDYTGSLAVMRWLAFSNVACCYWSWLP